MAYQDAPRMPAPPYGAAIQQAIVRGDLTHMKEIAAEAEAMLAKIGDVAAAYEALKIEIMRLGSSIAPPKLPSRENPDQPQPMAVMPYGPPIQQAVASGDLARMKEVAVSAACWLESQGDLSATLQLLRVEIAKLEAKMF